MVWITLLMIIEDILPGLKLQQQQLQSSESMDNKMDKLHARIHFQRDTANCCSMACTETWLDPTVPDSAIALAGFSIYQQDRTGQGRRGMLYG